VVGDAATDMKTTVGANRDGHEEPRGWRILKVYEGNHKAEVEREVVHDESKTASARALAVHI